VAAGEQNDTMGRTRIYVCVTCRTETDEQPRAGARFHAALQRVLESDPDPNLELVPVECLSVCRRPCTVSFAAPGKWIYVYGDLQPDADADLVRDAARLYAAAPDGLIPWRQRPDAMKKGVVARVPPLPAPAESSPV
jgi:predicted metal-binding protein